MMALPLLFGHLSLFALFLVFRCFAFSGTRTRKAGLSCLIYGFQDFFRTLFPMKGSYYLYQLAQVESVISDRCSICQTLKSCTSKEGVWPAKIFLEVPCVIPVLYPSSWLSKAYLCYFILHTIQEHWHQTSQPQITLPSWVTDGKSRLPYWKSEGLGTGLTKMTIVSWIPCQTHYWSLAQGEQFKFSLQ